jgi:hypothetical protein
MVLTVEMCDATAKSIVSVRTYLTHTHTMPKILQQYSKAFIHTANNSPIYIPLNEIKHQ